MLDRIKQILKKGNGKPNKSGSKSYLSFDLLYQLSYMASIADGGAPRSQIFENAARLPCSSAEYFKRVEMASKKLKYDYARACRVIGDSTKEEVIKGLLLRFSSSLISGESESEFLSRESAAHADNYENEYLRELDALKLWTDAYVSLTLSVVLVIIIGIVSTMIYKIETVFIMMMPLIAIFVNIIGIWLIYITSPKESIILRWAGSREQKLTKTLFKLFIPSAVAISAAVMLMDLNPGLALVAVAALAFPIGFITSRDNKKVKKRDAEVGSFVGSLGGVSAALGTTVSAALARLDLGAVNTLRRAAQQLHTRLTFGINPRICWKRFTDETGSELVNRSVGIFYDTVDLGGGAGQAGHKASLFASKISMLRAKRGTISSPFQYLCITMHGAVIMLLVFITATISSFSGMVAKAEEMMPNVSGGAPLSGFTSFNTAGLTLMNTLVLPLVLVFTVANAIAPYIAEGGSRYKILFNLGITASISGASMIFLPGLAQRLFTSVPM